MQPNPVPPAAPVPPPGGNPGPAPVGQQNGRFFSKISEKISNFFNEENIKGLKKLTPTILAILAAVGCLMLFPVLEGAALITACVIGTLCAVASGIFYFRDREFFKTHAQPDKPAQPGVN